MASLWFLFLWTKLARLRPVSSVRASILGLVIPLSAIIPAHAHEIRPAIADVTVDATSFEMEMQISFEAIVAGIDLQKITDSNEAPQAERYDELRALSSAEMEQAVRDMWPSLVQGFTIMAGETAIVPDIAEITVPEIGDIELARDSVLRLTAALPDDGTAVTIGWIAKYGPLVVRQTGDGDDAYSGYLIDGQLSTPLPRDSIAQESGLTAFGRYIVIGFEHIIPKGLDHILFVLGLFFFSMQMRPLLFQVTAFTLAHTVTLALAILGYVTVSPSIVEPLIAASIVYVAVENVFHKTITPWRTAVVFGFGLLHGLGFASVLGDIGLNPARFVSGLIGFNIGVELGQLAVILAAFLAVGLWFGKKPWYRKMISIPASILIAAVGAYWFIERVT